MNANKRYEIFLRFQNNNPKPQTELIYRSNFELLISVMLSAQATDVGVNKATKPLFAVANTPLLFLALGEEKLKAYIKSINYFNTKAKNIIKTCKILVEKHDGEVPTERTDLEALPGVGRKTANVILNNAYGEATIAVDTHIFRVANRTGLAKGKKPIDVEKKLLKSTPKEFLQDAHHWLVLHGRYICIARKPKCPDCFINNLCEYRHKTQIEK